MALFTGFHNAIVISLFPTIAINLIGIYHGGKWGESIGLYWPLAVFAKTGSVLGSQLLIVSDPAPPKLLLAAMALFGLMGGALAGIGR